MKTITLRYFQNHSKLIFGRIAKGERFLISYRGRPAARLEPLTDPKSFDSACDPFLTVGRRSEPSPKGKTRHSEIDRILYGRDR
jgi:antitoxin (DNA-binding transcriptional repressor) of toxin-antitoxin stability system